ncbi:hypothetical protein PLESTB_000555400 [Pleodorina starrii]|uniref:C2 domain-containing protein n=1 Tax=Pleodorina starrii TaxID=330485 RepID=A0A9W6BGL9_9CHLO|nr:hypothetical protein PLESTB_000555400 [Pleodorina starrii]GLC74532.1 hypothetical protein PLESTF_001524200 [Pleodorina starrii]
MTLEAGLMSINILYAKNIINKDWFGKQDPYCVVRVGGQTFRTQTAKDGGRNPVWNETFRMNLLNENDVSIDLKDEDVGRDDFIGSATFSLARARQTGHDRQEVPVFGPKSRKQQGFVSVALKWAPHRVPAAHQQPPPYPHPQWGAVQPFSVPQPQPQPLYGLTAASTPAYFTAAPCQPGDSAPSVAYG